MAVLSQSFDPDLRPEWVGRAARAWDIGPVIEAIVDADVEAAFPDRREDASFVAMLEKSITANLGQFRRFLIGEIALDDMKLESPIEFASMQAQLGISHSALQHSYRTGARVTWAMWAEHLAEAADEEPVPSSESAAGLRWSTAMFLAWYDHVVTSVDAGYTEREYMLRRSGFQFRVDTVRQILMTTCGSAPGSLSGAEVRPLRRAPHHPVDGSVGHLDPGDHQAAADRVRGGRLARSPVDAVRRRGVAVASPPVASGARRSCRRNAHRGGDDRVRGNSRGGRGGVPVRI